MLLSMMLKMIDFDTQCLSTLKSNALQCVQIVMLLLLLLLLMSSLRNR